MWVMVTPMTHRYPRTSGQMFVVALFEQEKRKKQKKTRNNSRRISL